MQEGFLNLINFLELIIIQIVYQDSQSLNGNNQDPDNRRYWFPDFQNFYSVTDRDDVWRN